MSGIPSSCGIRNVVSKGAHILNQVSIGVFGCCSPGEQRSDEAEAGFSRSGGTLDGLVIT
jgi:hypothetical protein